MQSYDVFNGDADGICSLHQLRLKYPCESTLITGVKRDINLLAGVPSPPAAVQDWHITVLDISYDKNRNDVDRLLDQGAEIEYFDHHYAGTVPAHPRLHTHIDTAPDRGTSFIVDACLNGQFRAWAIAGTFGDNFDGTARRLAASLAMPEEETSMLKELGILLNYNGYGTTVQDLFYHPADLYLSMKEFRDPMDFIKSSPAFNRLREGYESDMAMALGTAPVFSAEGNMVYILPDAPWARRVSGVFANSLARANPQGAHAVLTGLEGGGYVVSVRAPLTDRRNADTLCMKFPTGGGRSAAAGINVLNREDIDGFIEEFQKTYTHA